MEPKLLSDPTYRVESILGEGGGGVVYKAWHNRLQKYVVIKELHRGNALSRETQRNEVEALKHVKHPNLPQVYDFLTEGDRIFTVMEFIEGESLDRALAAGRRFDQKDVLRWFEQLASALAGIHEKGICHRDVKPANIMLTPRGDVCLIDFNAALVGGNDVRMVSRSLGYASPEQYEIYEKALGISPQAARETSADEATEVLSAPDLHAVDWVRSDLYSLGATIYHLLSGNAPAERAAEVVPLTQWGEFSEGMVYLVERLMSLRPAERFESASRLLTTVREIHRYDRRWKALQRRKLVAAIALPIACAVFVCFALFGAYRIEQDKETRYAELVQIIRSAAEASVALDAYESAAALYDRPDADREYALALYDQGRMEECRSFVTERLNHFDSRSLSKREARLYGELAYIAGKTYPTDPGETISYEDVQMQLQYFEIASETLRDMWHLYGDYAVALGRARGRASVEEIERALEKAQALGATEQQVAYFRAMASAWESDERKTQLLEEALQGDDPWVIEEAFLRLAKIRSDGGDWAGSVALLEQASERVSMTPRLAMDLADGYAKVGDFERGRELYDWISDHAPIEIEWSFRMILFLSAQKDFDRARELLDAMYREMPQEPMVPIAEAYRIAAEQELLPEGQRDDGFVTELYEKAVTLYRRRNPDRGDNFALDPYYQDLQRRVKGR
ncbi:MAG: serine/threonine-protein kinase [Bacillota bacterium]|nr:serine/threonine-protein kinase [Bacillota bacterium]